MVRRFVILAVFASAYLSEEKTDPNKPLEERNCRTKRGNVWATLLTVVSLMHLLKVCSKAPHSSLTLTLLGMPSVVPRFQRGSFATSFAERDREEIRRLNPICHIGGRNLNYLVLMNLEDALN